MPQAAQILASAICSAPHFGQAVSVSGTSAGAESGKLIAPVPVGLDHRLVQGRVFA